MDHVGEAIACFVGLRLQCAGDGRRRQAANRVPVGSRERSINARCSETTSSWVPRSSSTDDVQVTVDRTLAAIANKTSQPAGGIRATKFESSPPASTPSDASIGTRASATAISAAEAASAKAILIIARLRSDGVRQTMVRNGVASVFTCVILSRCGVGLSTINFQPNVSN